ncbi:MAG: leucyl/phenylalanyl-tRNA--protein transferase [Planctomycetota bacterium]
MRDPGSSPQQSRSPLSLGERRVVAATLAAYRQGAFPMCVHPSREGVTDELSWFEADPRGIMPLTEDEGWHCPRRLARTVRTARFDVTSDADFISVVQGCADPSRPGAWIGEPIIELFALLHRAGYAHSIEAWFIDDFDERHLVGGLYGLQLGRVFCAEAMFSRPDLGGTDASKVCLVHLVHHLRRQGFAVCDTQMWNEHLSQFGCVETRREDYLELLDEHAHHDVPWQPFDADATRAELERGDTE